MNWKSLLIVVIGLIVVGVGAFFTMNAVEANTLDKLYKQAKDAYTAENYEESIQLYKEVLSKDAGHVDARLELADAYVAVKDTDEAVAVIQEGIYETPKEPDLYGKLSSLYLSTGDIEKGYQTLDRGLTYVESDTLKQAKDDLTSKIYIHTERPLIQKGYNRKLELVYEGEGEKLTPLAAEWSVDKKTVTLEEKDGKKFVTLAGDQLGKAKVSVEWEDYTEQLDVEVVEQLLEKMTVEPEELEPVAVDETLDLSVTGTDAAGEEMTFEPEWSVDGGLFEIEDRDDQSATLTAVAEGKDTLTVSYDGLKETVDLFVEGDEGEKFIQTSAEGQGSVSVYPAEDSYAVGEDVTIEAIPAEGWEFAGWRGDRNDAVNPLNLTVEDHMQLTAVFEKGQHELSLAIEGEGNIVRDSLESTYPDMAEVSLRARAKDGWEFDHWEGSFTGTARDIVLTMDEDKSVRAVFVETEAEEAEPEETVSEESEEDSSPAPEQPKQETKPEPKPQPSPAPAPKPEPKPDPAPQPEPEPEPEPETYSLTMSVVGEGTIRASSKSAKAGQSISVSAVASDGWTFAGWQGDISGAGSSSSVTMDRNKQVTAVFKQVDTESQSTE
ncbi:tetratricopeptide repeat protein [Halobacillus sp. KGW1]|uniref:InlB B-repeat-containing protein n=1 Tax=Halobacillus sp. KGW1 TaxID=1793726 RepID=UPI0007850EEF|nr:tetratricopeptide repeat protein [Halobacillus sp. KGW1]